MLLAVGETNAAAILFGPGRAERRKFDLPADPTKFANWERGSIFGTAGNPSNRRNTSLFLNHPQNPQNLLILFEHLLPPPHTDYVCKWKHF